MAAMKIADRIRETSNGSGSGNLDLAGAVTGYQPVSVIGANNYTPLRVTDGVNWETGFYTYLTGPARIARTAITASSNGGAAVNWSGALPLQIECCEIAALGRPIVVSKNVAGTGDITLSISEQRCDILQLTGVLTGARNVIVDDTPWPYVVDNLTTGAFALTVKTSGVAGVAVRQGTREFLYCDGTAVGSARTPLRAVVIETSQDMSLASNFSLTGADFTPTAAICLASKATGNDATWGLAGAGREDGAIIVNPGTGYTHDSSLAMYYDGTNVNRIALVSYDAAGITLSRTKTNSPTGTLVMKILLLG